MSMKQNLSNSRGGRFNCANVILFPELRIFLSPSHLSSACSLSLCQLHRANMRAPIFLEYQFPFSFLSVCKFVSYSYNSSPEPMAPQDQALLLSRACCLRVCLQCQQIRNTSCLNSSIQHGWRTPPLLPQS